MAEKNVGFVGVGRMGGPMCRRLMEAGYNLTIFEPAKPRCIHWKRWARNAWIRRQQWLGG